jgi:hypothetical protein
VTLNFFRPKISVVVGQQPSEKVEPDSDDCKEEHDEDDSQHVRVNEEHVVDEEQ